MNPASDEPTVNDVVDRADARVGEQSWLWWQHNTDYVRATDNNETWAYGADVYEHAWLLLNHPDLTRQPPTLDEMSALHFCHGTIEHAIAHRTWTAVHQQVALRFEPTGDWEQLRRQLARSYRDHFEHAVAGGVTIDTGDTALHRPDGSPVGAGWLQQPAVTRQLDGGSAHDILMQSFNGRRLTQREADLYDQQQQPDDWEARARIRVATGNAFHLARWVAAHPASVTEALLNAEAYDVANTAWLSEDTISNLIANPTLDSRAAVAQLPVPQVRDFHHTHSPALRERFPQLASSTARALWGSWMGTIGELVAAVDHLEHRPAATTLERTA